MLSSFGITIPKKEHIQLKASVTPIDAVNASVSWRSSDEKVATVVSGKVTAKKAETATIYAKTGNGKDYRKNFEWQESDLQGNCKVIFFLSAC